MMNFTPEEQFELSKPKENLGFMGFLIRFRIIWGICLFVSTITALFLGWLIGTTIFGVLMVAMFVSFLYIYKPEEKSLNRKKVAFKEQRRRMTGL